MSTARRCAIVFASGLALALGAARAQPGPGQLREMQRTYPYAQPASSVARNGWYRDRRLMAAADSFAGVAAAALASPLPRVLQEVRVAQRAGDNVYVYIPASRRARFRAAQDSLDIALHHDRRPDLARDAMQAFRVLVRSESRHPQVPKALQLMEYSGWRYAADLHATPVSWPDMRTAAALAQKQWFAIAPRIANRNLRRRITRCINGMRFATRAHQVRIAARSVDRQLRLVPRAESTFKPYRHGA